MTQSVSSGSRITYPYKSSMTATPPIEQQIGQLFIIGFLGDSLDHNAPIIRDITRQNLGGVILFDCHLATGRQRNNIINSQQLQSLTHTLQMAAETQLLIGIDQEGGMVARLKEEAGFCVTPTAKKLGDLDDLEKTRTSSAQTAQMLAAVGINLNFAPVVDLNLNKKNPIITRYERSFSSDVTKVIAHSKAWIEGHSQYNILSCLKHFPGHGSSISDSHLGFVDISDSWHTTELEPYEELIRQGYPDAIMIGHLFNQNIDPDSPATLSGPTLNTLLRQKLQFKGVTISDDMQMKAITKGYGLVEACCKAIAAGVDLIIVGNNLDYDPEILKKIKDGVMTYLDENSITEQQIHNAWQRVQSLKKRLTKISHHQSLPQM